MLTEKQLLNLKPRASLYRLADGGGLCIEVPTTENLRWRYLYRFNRAAKMLSPRTYPEVKAAQARKLAAAAKDLLQKGTALSAQQQTDKITRHLSAATTFSAVGEKWLLGRNDLAAVTLQKHRWMSSLRTASLALHHVGPPDERHTGQAEITNRLLSPIADLASQGEVANPVIVTTILWIQLEHPPYRDV